MTEKETKIESVRLKVKELMDEVSPYPCREISLAKTKLDEFFMWAKEGINNY